jgi:glycosyltransferase involved in cell wall biosynthesis
VNFWQMKAPTAKHPFGITVVIPTFNREDMLQRALDSVRTTHTRQVEIVVVDDGSAVNQLPLLPPTNRSGVTVRGYRFERNRGPQAARNLGIRRARFSHIAFLDSDDEFTPDKIDAVLQSLQTQDIDVLFHAVGGMPRYSTLARLWSCYLRSVIPFTWLCALYNPVVTPALVVRRRCRLGLPSMRHCEDWFFLLRYIDAGMVVRYLDCELSIVHRRPGTSGGLSGAIWKMRLGEFKARSVLLRRPTVSTIVRYFAGSLAGLVRVASDAARGRYRNSC